MKFGYSTRLKPALDNYRAMAENFRKFECAMLELMRHPDSSTEDILMVRQKYVELYERVNDAHTKLATTIRGAHLTVIPAKPSLTDQQRRT